MIMAIGAAAGAAIGGIAASAGATAATVAAVTAVSVAAVNGLIIGAVVGAATSAITGGDILKGALIGGGIGAVTGGFGEWLSGGASLSAPLDTALAANAVDPMTGLTGAAAETGTAMTSELAAGTVASADAAAALSGEVMPGIVYGAGEVSPAATGATSGEGAAATNAINPPGGNIVKQTPVDKPKGLIDSITGGDSFTKAMLLSGGLQAVGSGITAATQPDQKELQAERYRLENQMRNEAIANNLPGFLPYWQKTIQALGKTQLSSPLAGRFTSSYSAPPPRDKNGLLAQKGAK